MDIDSIQEKIDYLESLKEPAREEARQLFPDHPKAQDIWVALSSRNGGVQAVASTLSLEDELLPYKDEFFRAVTNGCTESAILMQADFIGYCKQQLRDNFYMFK